VAAERPAENAIAALIDGYHGCALVYAAVRLDLPDRMASRAWTAEDLARQLGGLPDATYRLLRGLAAIGVCDEDSEGRFTLSPGGLALRADSDSGLREKALLAVEHYWPAWTGLANCVERTGTAFFQVFGTDAWTFRQEHVTLNGTFDAWMAKESASVSADIIAMINIGDALRVADIGGGRGSLLYPLLEANPHMTGILFDQPQVIGARPDAHPELALELVAGDFLEAVPRGADLYLLKSVVHDWDDPAARRILSNCRNAMSEGSRLLLIERVLPEKAREQPAAVLLDLHMMAVTGGRERTLPQLHALLEAEGFAASSVTTSASGHAVIESLPV